MVFHENKRGRNPKKFNLHRNIKQGSVIFFKSSNSTKPVWRLNTLILIHEKKVRAEITACCSILPGKFQKVPETFHSVNILSGVSGKFSRVSANFTNSEIFQVFQKFS